MTRAENLTTNKKDKLFPIKLREQDKKCILCKMPFENTIVWNESCCFDHLNDKRDINVDTNLAIVHKECNLIKRYNIDYKIRADEWRQHLESQIADSVREKKIISERVSEREKHTEANKYTDELKEGDINLIANKLTKAELEVQFPNKYDYAGFSYTKILQRIHYMLIQETGGRGSEQAVRRALDAYCSDYAPWKSEKLGKGNRIIRRRKPDELR